MSPAVNQIYIAVVGEWLSWFMSFFSCTSLGFVAHVFILLRPSLKEKKRLHVLFFQVPQDASPS